jgi:putative NIF3 family GTP cyclohydrolase 1 type 2
VPGNVSRRSICQQLTAGALLAPSLLRAQMKSQVSAREIVNRIKAHIGVPWHTPTSDDFKFGDPDAPVTGVTTTFMSTLEVLQRAHRAGNNFVITHEPTFWSADDEVATLRDDPLYRVKLKFLADNGMVVWRFHDHWHMRQPDGIFAGWDRAMGWSKPVVLNMMARYHEIPQTTLEELASEIQRVMRVKSMRLIGDPRMKVRRVGNAAHYITQCMQLMPSVDVLLVFECREWEAAEYVRDAIAAGQQKALIQLPHEAGEEAGMDECARWVSGFVPEVPVQFMAAADPFWIPT